MRCPVCNTPNPAENQRCQECGEKLPRPRASAEEKAEPPRPRPPEEIDEEEDEEEYERRPARRRTRRRDDGSDVVSTLIPYRNPKALAAYYLGFFAFLPGLGFVLAVVAIILGILGIRHVSANPTAKGTAHAITGIVLGVLALFCWNPIVCFLLYLVYLSDWLQ